MRLIPRAEKTKTGKYSKPAQSQILARFVQIKLIFSQLTDLEQKKNDEMISLQKTIQYIETYIDLGAHESADLACDLCIEKLRTLRQMRQFRSCLRMVLDLNPPL
jgi:hypothetical protein